jgi:hypothetical protein
MDLFLLLSSGEEPMTQIFGSHKCPNCDEKFDWLGKINNLVDEDMQKKIIENQHIRYARFFEGTDRDFKVEVRCSHCNYPVEFNYGDNKKAQVSVSSC